MVINVKCNNFVSYCLILTSKVSTWPETYQKWSEVKLQIRSKHRYHSNFIMSPWNNDVYRNRHNFVNFFDLHKWGIFVAWSKIVFILKLWAHSSPKCSTIISKQILELVPYLHHHILLALIFVESLLGKHWNRMM